MTRLGDALAADRRRMPWMLVEKNYTFAGRHEPRIRHTESLTGSAAVGIFDGLQNADEEIFPDPAPQSVAEGWRVGISKALERQFAAFVPQDATSAA